MYATFGSSADLRRVDGAKIRDVDELIDRAIASGDEHAIKFTEVCLREYALNPNPAFFAAAEHATHMLSRS
jgi:hypothetical protein